MTVVCLFNAMLLAGYSYISQKEHENYRQEEYGPVTSPVANANNTKKNARLKNMVVVVK